MPSVVSAVDTKQKDEIDDKRKGIDMTNIFFRWMEPQEIFKLRDIDRTEQIRIGYSYVNGKLEQTAVSWDSPAWKLEGDDSHSVESKIRFCQDHLDRHAEMYGAFDEEKLVGIGILQPDVALDMAELAFLHVSNHYRQQGIARTITEVLVAKAVAWGAKRMYVSATPSGSAVGFYLSQGFKPTDTPIPELFELEPEDIHMIKVL